MNGLALMTDMFHFNEGEIGFEDCGRDNGFRYWYAYAALSGFVSFLLTKTQAFQPELL